MLPAWLQSRPAAPCGRRLGAPASPPPPPHPPPPPQAQSKGGAGDKDVAAGMSWRRRKTRALSLDLAALAEPCRSKADP